MAEHCTSSSGPDDLSLRPWTEDEDLTGWEVVADSSDTQIAFAYTISFTPEETRLIVEAECCGDLNVFQVAKQAVLERARALAGEEAARLPPNGSGPPAFRRG